MVVCASSFLARPTCNSPKAEQKWLFHIWICLADLFTSRVCYLELCPFNFLQTLAVKILFNHLVCLILDIILDYVYGA